MAYEGVISTGSNVQGVLEAPGDVDIYRAELIGNIDYVVSVLGASNAGGSLANPAVGLFDSNGNLVAQNDDTFALGLDPLLQFKAPTSGPYAIGVADVTGGVGDYSLVFDQAGPPITFGGPIGEAFLV